MDILTNNPIYKAYHFLNYDLTDKKTTEYALVMRPISLIMLLIIYNLGCLKWGPKLMEKRKPFELRNVIIAFDIFQIAANAYLFYMAIYGIGWFHHYNGLCGEVDTRDDLETQRITSLFHNFLLLKISDLLDTVFMVLKKKNNHISFLHMYHHTGMVMASYVNIKYVTGGHHTCIGLYNTLVHVVMYSYYLCAALYPNINWLSMKKLVTKLQMFQFMLIGFHMLTPLFVPNCKYPRWAITLLVPNNFLMFFLFYDFYRKTYVLKKKTNSQSGNTNIKKH